MMKMLLKLILNILFGPQKDSDLALENLALRQQLAILKRHKKRPQIRTKDRLFWIMLCRFWRNWQEPLIVVKPETVIWWHRKGFNLMHSWDIKLLSQTGRTFLKNHMMNMISTDFFTAPTATFRIFFLHHVVLFDVVAEDRGLKILRSSRD
mgnify:CR=1 FL=1